MTKHPKCRVGILNAENKKAGIHVGLRQNAKLWHTPRPHGVVNTKVAKLR